MPPGFNLLAHWSVYPNRDDVFKPVGEEIGTVESSFMTGNTRIRTAAPVTRMVALFALLAVLSITAPAIHAQAATRFLGSITAISGNSVTVKTAAGDVHQFEVPAAASIKRIEPGQTSLANAVTIQLSDLAVGDRVLVLLDANATGPTPQAAQIVAIKHEDLAKKQEQEREAWQQGVGGLVKSVDPGSGVIVLTAGAGSATKTITIRTTSATTLKRYAPGSVLFDQAQPAPIADIHPGDQLRARGTKSADGTEMTADAVVSGSFRNISGLITSIDASNSTVNVKDLATKKEVTIHITPDAQMRRLPERMATFLAARLKGQAGAGGAGGRPESMRPQNGGEGSMRHEGGGEGGGRGGMDPEQLLSRAPEIKIADLQKGEAVMIVATQGASEVTAITLVAGVEPLLEAPASQDLLSNWSMNSGSAAAEGAGTP